MTVSILLVQVANALDEAQKQLVVLVLELAGASTADGHELFYAFTGLLDASLDVRGCHVEVVVLRLDILNLLAELVKHSLPLEVDTERFHHGLKCGWHVAVVVAGSLTSSGRCIVDLLSGYGRHGASVANRNRSFQPLALCG